MSDNNSDPKSLLRVAVAQHGTGTDVAENLSTAKRLVTRAAAEGAELVVLPEFGNHLSVYDSFDHAWDVAIDADGVWPREIGELAKEHNIWVQFNCTVRRNGEESPSGTERITNTNFVISPNGQVALQADKTVLMGAEGEFLSPADTPSEQIDAGFAVIGSYACMDGIVPEVPRCVAAGGARLLLNSLNSFALDEASLHIPVRAGENRAWVLACCKVGPLLPPEKLAMFSEMMGVPEDALHGAGESQIVAPDGTVVAQAPSVGEAVVVADIDLAMVNLPRPDGTDLWASRRPELYGDLTIETPPQSAHHRAEEVAVAVSHEISEIGKLAGTANLVVLPELAIAVPADLDRITEQLAGTDCVVVSSMRESNMHVGVAINSGGVLARQGQLHPVVRHDWATENGTAVEPIDLGWGRLAIVVGEVVLYPETARLAAINSVDVLAVPMCALEPWDTTLAVPERGAENRMCVVAANAIGAVGDSQIADLPPDLTLWAQPRHRPFDGTINQPDISTVKPAVGASGNLEGTIHPIRSLQRQISKNTDLVDGRPWEICKALVN